MKKVAFRDDKMCLVSVRNLAIAHWTGAPAFPHFEAIAKQAHLQRGLYPGGCAFASIVSVARLPRLSLGMRRRLKGVLHDRSGTDLASVHVIALEGPAGPVARALVRVLLQLLGHDAPSSVFGNSPPARAFLLAHLGRGDEAWTDEQLARAFESI